MIAELSLVLGLLAQVGATDRATSVDDADWETQTYDLRWLYALEARDPFVEDLQRRGLIELTDDWGSWYEPLYTSAFAGLQLEDWMTCRFPGVGFEPSHGTDMSWLSVHATPQQHAKLDAELAQVHKQLRRAVRVRWVRFETGVDLSAQRSVLQPAEVQELLSSAPIAELHSGTTTPGRGAHLRTRDSIAMLGDHDVEDLATRPSLDPQVVVQRSGVELITLPLLEADGSWDVRVFMQDCVALPSRVAHYPEGREPIVLPAVRSLWWSAGARVPDGGGLLLENTAGDEGAQWLLIVERAMDSPATADRLRPLGRLARDQSDGLPHRIYAPSPSGGYGWGEGELWPFHPHRTRVQTYVGRVLDLVAFEHHDTRSAHAAQLGPYIAFGPRPDSARRTVAALDELEQAFPSYSVELRARREARSDATHASEPGERANYRVRSAVRAGDSMTTALLEERCYLQDADTEVGGSLLGLDPQIHAVSNGVTLLVRCLPTRSGRIDVTCEWQDVVEARAALKLLLPLNTATMLGASSPLEEGYEPLRSSELFELEFPQQSDSRIRAKFLAEPGEWTLVGSMPIASTADQLTVWVKLTQIAD